ncbi:protein scd2/ral3 [Lipomyces kononenkoae]|uniref:Protein scd2/ral3 n=1 Tax=Lipomyces kononenkoae TaxID=34357 RepID=A0ACC3T7A0_LIPKO
MIKGLRRSLKGERDATSTSNPHPSITQKSPLTILPPKKVIKALYDYQASTPGELSFSKGDFFHVIGNENDLNWYEACNPSTNLRGMVPVTYFQVLGRNERESVGSNDAGKKSFGPSEFSSSPAVQSPSNRRSSGVLSSASSSSSGKRHYTPLYGVVQYDFVAERPDELEAYEGDAVIVVAQSNHEWFVAKPIGRLGGPGLLPISYVEIRDMTTGKPVENIEDAIAKAGVPRVEEWKKRTAEYKASSIPLGKFEDDASLPFTKFQQMSISPQLQQQYPQSYQQEQQKQFVQGPANNADLSWQFTDRLSQHPSEPSDEPAVLSATVDRFLFDNNRYWYLLIAEMEDGTFRNLCRYYEDFYDFQIRLLDEYPDEAGRTGRQRILPFIPGPVTFVNDSISSQRRVNLDEYVQKLIALPNYISRSSLVKGLFALRAGDVESQHAGSALPQPYNRDSRMADASGQGDKRISTVYPSTTIDQANLRTSRPVHHHSMDRLRSTSSAQLASARYGSTGRLSNVSTYSSSSTTNSGGVRESVATSKTSSINGGPRDTEMERNPSSVSESTMSSLNGQPLNRARLSGQLKIKIFYQDDLIAIRVPVDIEYSQLENKLHERLGSSNLTFYFQDEQSGQHYLLRSNEDLAAAVANSSKLVLYAQ